MKHCREVMSHGEAGLALPSRHPEGLVGLDVLGTYVRVQMGQQSYCTETASEDSSWILGLLLAMVMVM